MKRKNQLGLLYIIKIIRLQVFIGTMLLFHLTTFYMQNKGLPIGYWIKQANKLLTEGIDDIQSSFGATRTEWQILNYISEKGFIEKSYLTDLMSPFADTTSVESILAKSKIRHLINEKENEINLTEKGTELHSACFEKQKVFRQSIMTDISEQNYQTTILTLQKIVENITKKNGLIIIVPRQHDVECYKALG